MRVKCPNCGRERIISAGKKKKCRKCGLELTATGEPAQPKISAHPAVIATASQMLAKLTLAELVSQRPDLVEAIRGEKSPDKSSKSDAEPADPAEKYARLSKAKLIGELKTRGYNIDKEIKGAKKAELILYLVEDDNDLPEQ